ncbi:hypothetical protein DPEC_G00338900 [Dallia pectoralis]|uniref:Uncharacterized protein n=1 Tax=Dallia pectoralis TaxID=75939 RepID=A0ACC2F4Q2_DALPE|nr:hypothetical protein DPEC_G00338900 [Dallia pectoralis]
MWRFIKPVMSMAGNSLGAGRSGLDTGITSDSNKADSSSVTTWNTSSRNAGFPTISADSVISGVINCGLPLGEGRRKEAGVRIERVSAVSTVSVRRWTVRLVINAEANEGRKKRHLNKLRPTVKQTGPGRSADGDRRAHPPDTTERQELRGFGENAREIRPRVLNSIVYSALLNWSGEVISGGECFGLRREVNLYVDGTSVFQCPS